jgi:uncharacterized protein YbcI
MSAEPEVRVQPTRSPAAEISNAVVRLMREYTGRGPTQARTMITDELITVITKNVLTKAEECLHSRGESDTVRSMRRKFQETMREDLISAVESISGRKVIAFLSDNHMDPDIAVELFVTERELRSVDPEE